MGLPAREDAALEAAELPRDLTTEDATPLSRANAADGSRFCACRSHRGMYVSGFGEQCVAVTAAMSGTGQRLASVWQVLNWACTNSEKAAHGAHIQSTSKETLRNRLNSFVTVKQYSSLGRVVAMA